MELGQCTCGLAQSRVADSDLMSAVSIQGRIGRQLRVHRFIQGECSREVFGHEEGVGQRQPKVGGVATMGIATIEYHVDNLRIKTGAEDRLKLAVLAHQILLSEMRKTP